MSGLPGLRTFSSMVEFADHLLERQAAVVTALRTGLEICAESIEKTAKEEIGNYQDAIGPFEAWPDLADSTKADRVAKGYSEDEPLLREGDLRDSIRHEVGALDAFIGSDSDIAVYQELGTDKIPPRPFLGTALFHNEGLIREVMGGSLVAGILGEDVKSLTHMTEGVIGT